MARLGTIQLGGHINTDSNRTLNSGIGFFLDVESRISKVFSFNCGTNEAASPHVDTWEVEVKEKHKSIVARCSRSLNPDQILKCGFEVCQKALDLLSVVNRQNMILKDPGISHVLLFKEENEYVLREVSNMDLSFSIEASVTVRNKNGNIVPQPIPAEPEWLRTFRYYRLSQTTKDLYEAYRNLYLSFESALSQVCPIKKREREIDWLRRALNGIKAEVNLSEYMPDENGVPKSAVDPVDYIIENQYKLSRLGLFHSKEDVILPHALPNPEMLLKEHRRLIQIWYAIVSGYFNVPTGGGEVTDQGFKDLMSRAFDNGYMFQVTDDPTPSEPDDSVVSPLNYPVISFNDFKFEKDYALGQVLLTGRLERVDLGKVELIHRIGLVKDCLITVEFIDDGLFVEGVDKIELNQVIRLINANNPKTDF